MRSMWHSAFVITIIDKSQITIIGIVFAVKRGSGGTTTPKPARQDLDDYEEQYLARQGQRPRPKPAETRPTSSFCDSCGAKLKPAAKFCGKCGSKQ